MNSAIFGCFVKTSNTVTDPGPFSYNSLKYVFVYQNKGNMSSDFSVFLFLKKILEAHILFVGPLIPLFWTSGDVCPRVSKPGWIPRLLAVSPVCNGFLRFTSGATPTDLLTASMVAVRVPYMPLHFSLFDFR